MRHLPRVDLGCTGANFFSLDSTELVFAGTISTKLKNTIDNRIDLCDNGHMRPAHR